MDVHALLESTLTGLGYELVDHEFSRSGLMRVFIDTPNGITVEDCVTVSNQLVRVFTVENIDFERLEVSSPGLDRPLKKEADFVRFIGREATLRLRRPLETQRRFVGILRGYAEGTVSFESEDGRQLEIPFENIDKARLVPDI